MLLLRDLKKGNLMISLIKGAAALNKGIKSFGRAYSKIGATAHLLAVSAIAHAAEHGDPSPLNTFNAILKTNDKQALRLYISRAHAVIGGYDGTSTQTVETMQAFKAKGAFIFYTVKDGYGVIPKDVLEAAPANRTALLAMIDEMLMPDGVKWTEFMDRNNFSETKTLGDTQLQRLLDGVIKRAKGTKKNLVSTVSQKNLDALIAAQAVIGKPPTAVTQLN